MPSGWLLNKSNIIACWNHINADMALKRYRDEFLKQSLGQLNSSAIFECLFYSVKDSRLYDLFILQDQKSDVERICQICGDEVKIRSQKRLHHSIQ